MSLWLSVELRSGSPPHTTGPHISSVKSSEPSVNMDMDPRDILLQVYLDTSIHSHEIHKDIQISAKKNIPGNLREEIKKFVEFAEDRVIKHQVGSGVSLSARLLAVSSSNLI